MVAAPSLTGAGLGPNRDPRPVTGRSAVACRYENRRPPGYDGRSSTDHDRDGTPLARCTASHDHGAGASTSSSRVLVILSQSTRTTSLRNSAIAPSTSIARPPFSPRRASHYGRRMLHGLPAQRTTRGRLQRAERPTLDLFSRDGTVLERSCDSDCRGLWPSRVLRALIKLRAAYTRDSA